MSWPWLERSESVSAQPGRSPAVDLSPVEVFAELETSSRLWPAVKAQPESQNSKE